MRPSLSLAVRPALSPARHTREGNDVAYRKKLSFSHTAQVALRNAIYAAIGRVAIGLLKQLAKRGLSKAFLRRAGSEFFSLNPLKWAAVFGGFSTFRFCVQIVVRCGRYVNMPEKLSAFIAGFICSTPALVMNRETRTELCLYALVRALHTFSLRFILPRLPKALQEFDHYDTLLMCISATQITYGGLFQPSTLPKSYQGFLTKAAMVDQRLMRGHCGAMRGLVSPELADYCAEKNIVPFDVYSPGAPARICQLIHPGHSCTVHALAFVPRSMLYTGIPLYGPLRVVATLATQRKKLMAQPVKTITRGVKSVLTSALFLALYVACIVRVGCFGLHRGDRGGARTALLSFFAGVPTLLEPKGRRMDLALYCAMYALRSFVLSQYRLGRLPYPRHWFVMLTYFTSVSFLFFEYEEEPKLLNPRVYSAFRLLLGERAPVKAAAAAGDKAPHSTSTPQSSRSPAMRAKEPKELPEDQKLTL